MVYKRLKKFTLSEIVSYLVKHGLLKDASINTAKGRNKAIVQNNIDFLTRFLQRADYYEM